MNEQFFADCLSIIDEHGEAGCAAITERLRALLTPETERAINRKGRTTLHERIGGLTILGHHHPESIWSMPHDHGRTWAIYGVLTGRTAMYEFERIDRSDKPNVRPVRLIRGYWIMPGMAFWYPTGAIHQHKTFGDSKLIRIEGMNLWRKGNKAGGRRYQMVEGS